MVDVIAIPMIYGHYGEGLSYFLICSIKHISITIIFLKLRNYISVK